MTFGQKLKKLRTDKNLTQEQLAQRLFVTRTAISKWETDSGYPGIDSLKLIADFFGVTIDQLISDDDVANQRALEQKRATKCYIAAVIFLVCTVIFALLSYFWGQIYFNIGGVVCLIGYVVFALLAKPKYKRIEARKVVLPYVISRIVIFAIVAGVMVYTILSL